jgi:D-lyxose ketol-isomerase
MFEISRRKAMGGIIAGAASVAVLGGTEAKENAKEQRKGKKKMKVYENDHFYGADGAFEVDVAKAAFYEMMEHHKYPIPERLRGEDFWTLDFGLGLFTEIGMAGIFWVNNLEHNYFGHEIYLLPGQSIPEHRHLKTEAAGPKLEGWHVRHGSILTYGEDKTATGDSAKILPSHKDCLVAKSAVKVLPGEVATLHGPEEWHWMKGGPEGAIVTEYATYHDGDGLRFSHPKAKM